MVAPGVQATTPVSASDSGSGAHLYCQPKQRITARAVTIQEAIYEWPSGERGESQEEHLAQTPVRRSAGGQSVGGMLSFYVREAA